MRADFALAALQGILAGKIAFKSQDQVEHLARLKASADVDFFIAAKAVDLADALLCALDLHVEPSL